MKKIAHTFTPPRLLRNPHIQSIFASSGPRKLLVRRRARDLRRAAQTVQLDCGEGVTLQGEYSAHPAGAEHSRGLVIMIHGWEGSVDSLYLQSTGATLFAQGYSIFRLNLRDHGPTHHLNKELFNSTRLREVAEAVRVIQQRFPHQHNYLTGFSLGGNFSLRVANCAEEFGIKLDRVVAVCPVINPVNTMRNLQEGFRLYHDYFRLKWSNSLKKKLQHYPELGYGDKLLQLKTLQQMNDYFVPNFTDFDDSHSYLLGYSVIGDRLKNISSPCHILSSADDPVILVEDLQQLEQQPLLQIELSRYGGHCGFIENYRLDSWIDGKVLSLLQP